MDTRETTCPTCLGDIGPIERTDETNTVDQYCDSCSALLRLRYFRGALVDIEDLDHRLENRAG